MQSVSDDDARKTVAANLKRLRGSLSLAEVGRLAQTSAGAIRDIESGTRMPGIGLLSRLADVFQVSVDEFLRRPKKSA